MYKSPDENRPPAAEILTIGDELGRGEIVDTNTAWLAQQLTELGLQVRYRSGTNDQLEDICEALQRAACRARVVVVSGGLGPTEDDITVEAACALWRLPVVIDPAHEARLRSRFAERGVPLTPNNLRQLRVPQGAEVIENPVGLAPGFRLDLGPAACWFFPGVPRELRAMFTSVAARIREHGLAGAEAAVVLRRTFRVIGLGESHVDHRLRGMLDGLPADLLARQAQRPTLHFRLSFPEVLVTVVARSRDSVAARELLDSVGIEVRRRLGGAVYSEGEDDLPVVVGRKLAARGETLAVAESCTGGLLGALVTAVPGSSAYFLGGVIAYADAVKQALLGVSADTLARHGAVSEPCVRQMAEGVRHRLGAVWGAALSGIAGPTGGSVDKPVGTVHLALAGPTGTVARRMIWPGDRDQVRRIAALAALNLLDRALSPERAAPPEGGAAPGEERL
ncbi:MAG: competence/damage-inducible protein A [Myxococcales bacterium]|nr:competence/damage-inducible protein A [Myxococcota bacterium]MDW8281321.1 competence/damage-inducible protein A [Myxococcales bacterium]